MRSDRACVICGGAFRPRGARQVCCSLECQRERKRRYCRRWYAVPANREKQIRDVLRRYHARRGEK